VRRDSIMFAIVVAAATVATVFTASNPSAFGVIVVAWCWLNVGQMIWKASA
jgi:hypothetical protein